MEIHIVTTSNQKKPITLFISANNHFSKRVENVKNGDQIELNEYVPIDVTFSSNSKISGLKFSYEVGEAKPEELKIGFDNKATLKLPKKDLYKPTFDITLIDDSNTNLKKKNYNVSIDSGNKKGTLKLKKSRLLNKRTLMTLGIGTLVLAILIIGGVFLFGDSDNDNVRNIFDKCPNSPAHVKVDKKGCPLNNKNSDNSKKDTDGDGVVDNDDKCPEEGKRGEIDEKGCPLNNKNSDNSKKDTDVDGVVDKDDKCPEEGKKGEIDEKGCPSNNKNSDYSKKDTDGDGVVDKDDECPEEGKRGEIDEKGCPIKVQIAKNNTDTDGIKPNHEPCKNYNITLKKLKAQLDSKDFKVTDLDKRIKYLTGSSCGFNYNAEITNQK